MATAKRVSLVFIDGTKHVVTSVTHIEVSNSCIALWCRRYMSGMGQVEEHLGTYPLVNIQSWHEEVSW